MKYLVLLVVLVFLVYGVMFAVNNKREDQSWESESRLLDFVARVVCGFYILASHIRDGAVASYKAARDDLKP